MHQSPQSRSISTRFSSRCVQLQCAPQIIKVIHHQMNADMHLQRRTSHLNTECIHLLAVQPRYGAYIKPYPTVYQRDLR